MANVKISELPNATSLSNGDSFPVVQGGVTKQAARSVLFASPTFTGTTTAAILTATGDVTFDGGAFVFNDSGADKDARFEGDTDANLLFLDASTDRVGIGTATPGAKLEVNGAVLCTNNNGLSIRSNLGTPNSVVELDASNVLVIGGGGATDSIEFWSSGAERMRLDSSGNVGIGTTSPATKLHVDTGAAGYGLTLGAVSETARTYQLGVVSGGALSIYDTIAGAERARITSAGDFIHQVNGAAPSLSTNSTMSFELTSNTSLKIVVRGTDGTTRSVSLTLA